MTSTTSAPPGDQTNGPETQLRVLHGEGARKVTGLQAFRSVGLADIDSLRYYVYLAVAIAFVAAGVRIDEKLMIAPIDRTMRVEDGAAEQVALLFALLAGVCAWHAGKYLREVRAHGRGVAPFWLALGAFIAIGAAFFVMRLVGEDIRVVAGREQNGLALAALFLLTYLAVGLLAMVEAYLLTNPALVAKLRAQRLLDRVSPQVSGAEATVVETEDAFTTSSYRVEAVPRERDEAIAATHAVAAEARDYARLLIAMHLADPAATGLVHDRYPADDTNDTAAHHQKEIS